MKCGGHCENVKLQMGDYHLKTHMFSINMGGCDIVFGIEWLRTLGPIAMDFKELYMSFVNDSHTLLHQGIRVNPPKVINSHRMEKLLKKWRSSIIPQFHAIQGCETTRIDPPSQMK